MSKTTAVFAGLSKLALDDGRSCTSVAGKHMPHCPLSKWLRGEIQILVDFHVQVRLFQLLMHSSM